MALCSYAPLRSCARPLGLAPLMKPVTIDCVRLHLLPPHLLHLLATIRTRPPFVLRLTAPPPLMPLVQFGAATSPELWCVRCEAGFDKVQRVRLGSIAIACPCVVWVAAL